VFQNVARNPALVNNRSKPLVIKLKLWPQTWRRASSVALFVGILALLKPMVIDLAESKIDSLALQAEA
jgi:hypothetical protein